jgi:hypothetical protein
MQQYLSGQSGGATVIRIKANQHVGAQIDWPSRAVMGHMITAQTRTGTYAPARLNRRLDFFSQSRRAAQAKVKAMGRYGMHPHSGITYKGKSPTMEPIRIDRHQWIVVAFAYQGHGTKSMAEPGSDIAIECPLPHGHDLCCLICG